MALEFRYFTYGSAPAAEEKAGEGRRGETDETDARALTISGIFWQEYQSRAASKRAERARAERKRRGEE